MLVLGVSSVAERAEAVPKTLLRSRPRLVVVMVVDQLRADYLTRHINRFLPARDDAQRPGGFGYLIDQGSYFPIAEYEVMHSLTAPDHATISTGAWPNRHGIVMNRYFDGAHKSRYCVGDRRYRVLGGSRASQKRGTAPTNLLAPTLGDALKNAGYRGRVVSVAMKDRAAILMGGYRADAALWFDYTKFRWVTSTYYAHDAKLPVWVGPLNKRIASQVGKSLPWVSKGPGSGHSDDGPADGHRQLVTIGSFESLESPYGHVITVDAALAALKHHEMGRDDEPDILWVGFSSFDYLGHGMGPNHRLMEESLVALDREISRLLAGVEKHAKDGLDRVTLVLTGDHGAPPMPAYLKRHHVRAGYLDGKLLHKELEAYLTKRFGSSKGRQWIAVHTKLHFTFDSRTLERAGISRRQAEGAAKEFLETLPNVATVATGTEIRGGYGGPGLTGRQIINGYYPGRSGDVVVLPAPYFMPKTKGLTHSTGYTYDRSVPLILAGSAFRNELFAQRPKMIDLVPTLSFLLGIVPPAFSEGRVLHEVFRDAAPKTVTDP